MDPEPLSSVEKEAIKESLEDIKHGMVYTLEEVKKELGFNRIFRTVFFQSEEGFEESSRECCRKIRENLEYISSDLHCHIKKLKGNPFLAIASANIV